MKINSEIVAPFNVLFLGLMKLMLYMNLNSKRKHRFIKSREKIIGHQSYNVFLLNAPYVLIEFFQY